MRSHLHDVSAAPHGADPLQAQRFDDHLSPALLPLIGVAIYLATSMFYVFPSGNPQPADVVLLASMIGTVLCVWRRFPSLPIVYLAAFMFVAWILVVNTTWFLMIGDVKFVARSIFYFYNIFVFLFGVIVYYHDPVRLRAVAYWSLVVAAMIQVVYIELFASGAGRALGTFNNPNQLGYWGLAILACFAVVKERDRLGFIDVGVMLCAGYAVMRSLSKAASLSAAFLILMMIVFCGFKRGSGKVLGVLFVTVMVAEVASGGYFGFIDRFTSAEHVSRLEDRLSGIGDQQDDNVLTRGYYRIIDNPHLLAFGAGEAAFDRIDRFGDPKEFHSTLGNLLMSYGLVGIGLFFFLLALVFWRAHISSLAYFVPLMLYGVTHNGIRGSLLWFFLALVFGQSRYGKEVTLSLASLFGRRSPPQRAGPDWSRRPAPHPATASPPHRSRL